MTDEKKQSPFDIPNYYQAPNIFVDAYLKTLTGAETKLMVAITRQTRGWKSIGKVWEEATLSDFSKITGLGKTQIRDSIKSLIDKKLIVTKFSCARCKKEFSKKEFSRLAQDFACPICKSKESPNRLYKLNDGSEEDEELEGNVPESELRNKKLLQKVTPPPPKSDPPPSRKRIPPPPESASPPSRRMSDGVELQERKEILFKETLNTSLSERLTKEDPGVDWENFDILEERENFSEKEEQEEERKEERDFRLIKEPEQNQTENEGMVKFTAGLLAGIGNQVAFEEKKIEREDKSGEKEVTDLLNTCIATGWNLQITKNDKEIIKEIMKFPYKDIEASCEDRMNKNRPVVAKVFTKWVLDGLRSGIKAKRLTQLEKEDLLHTELEKYYKNGNGDKVSCRDTIRKLYSVISIVGIMENRYRTVMDWCEWQY